MEAAVKEKSKRSTVGALEVPFAVFIKTGQQCLLAFVCYLVDPSCVSKSIFMPRVGVEIYEHLWCSYSPSFTNPPEMEFSLSYLSLGQ